MPAWILLRFVLRSREDCSRAFSVEEWQCRKEDMADLDGELVYKPVSTKYEKIPGGYNAQNVSLG